MKTNFKNEIVTLLVVAIPFIYLALIWGALPDIVPTHWNARGEVDDTGSKFSLLIIPIMLPLLTYLLLLVIPFLDPRKKLAKMGNKYNTIKLVLVLSMSVLATAILYATQNASVDMGKVVFVIIGGMFVALGNYFKTIKPNYFMGIRTPWTLESDYVWKETHNLGGKVWMIGGLIVIAVSLIVTHPLTLTIVNASLLMVLAFIPTIYSYTLFQKEKKESSNLS